MCLWLALVLLSDFISKRVEPVKRYEHLAGSDAALRRGPKAALIPTARRVAYAQIEPH